MPELLLKINWILFYLLIILALSGFFYIRNAFKKNIKISDARIAQWAFSVILSLMYGFTKLNKNELIVAIPIFYALSVTYLGRFISMITLALLSNFIKNEQEILPAIIGKETHKTDDIRRLSFEFADNIPKIILPKTALTQKNINEMEGLVFSIFIIYVFYVLIVQKADNPKHEIDQYGAEMRSFVVENMYQKFNGNTTKEDIDQEVGTLYAHLQQVRFDQYYLWLENGINLSTTKQLMGIFADNYFIEPLNEADKKHFVINMSLMFSDNMEKLFSEIKW